MNAVKKIIRSALNEIDHAEFGVSCWAYCGKFRAPVDLQVIGLNGQCDNADIIDHLKRICLAETFANIDPMLVHKTVMLMPVHPAARAWAMAIMWFACVANNRVNGPWTEVYKLWVDKYDPDYNDIEARDGVMLALGLTKEWIEGESPKYRTRLECVLGEVGLMKTQEVNK